jgi:hypothetical protein
MVSNNRWLSSRCVIAACWLGAAVSSVNADDVIRASGVAAPIDETYTRAIREATTDSRFLTTWVDTLSDHPSVPNPRKYLGYIVGAPGKVSDVEQIHGYYRALAAASTRARLFSFGTSDEGREGLVLAIADEETIRQLDRYKQDLHALADPRRTDAAEAAKIIARTKPIYWVTAGLHSDELGPPEMAMELAYRLLTEERPPFTTIRRNIITLITPILEVDGRARQVDWTRRYATGHKDEFDRPPPSVPYWGKYIHHDNNRDSILASQRISQNYFNVYFDWLPPLALDLHESVPYLYVMGGTGPYNEALDATTTAEWHLLANYEVTRLTGLGLPGVWTWAYTDGWYPGFLVSVTNNHNASGRFFEGFGNSTPDTLLRDISEKKYAGQPVTSRQWYRPAPPQQSTLWSMRNNTNYLQSGVIASLEAVANDPSLFLGNFYERGRNAIRQGRQHAPHAFVIPMQQRDRGAAWDLIEGLRRQRIEMGRVQGAISSGDARIGAGDVVIKLDQPYGPLARNLLEIQKFPRNDAVPPPYDDVAWTLGLLLGVSTLPIDDPAALDWSTTPLQAREDPFAPVVPDQAAAWVVRHRAQQNLGPFRFALKRAKVYAAEEAFAAAGESYPAGSLLIRTADLAGADIRALLHDFRLEGTALPAMPEVGRHELDLPRIAVLQSWTYTQKAGWLRFIFDTARIPYELIDEERLRRGNLRREYDVVLIPSYRASTTAAELIRGFDTKWGRLAYEKTAATPNLGGILSSHDIAGGFGFDGMRSLQRFVVAGGTLITLESAGVLVADTGLSTRITAERPPGLNTPGSVTTTRILDPLSPLVYGYEEVSHVFHGNGPLYKVPTQQRDSIVMQFGAKLADAGEGQSQSARAPLILSGGVLAGEEALDGSPALLLESVGRGKIVVFGWNPMHRDLTHHDYAFLYNALLNWNDLDRPRDPASADPHRG